MDGGGFRRGRLRDVGPRRRHGRTLDNFTSLAPWTAKGSDGVSAALAPDRDSSVPALRLDYGFGAVSGYAVAARPLPLDLPGNFALRFRVRMSQPNNTLQVKLTDASGENVWWRVFPPGALPATWTDIAIPRRRFDFAWGPNADKTLRRADHIEFVVAKGAAGGAGSLSVSDLTLQPLPPEVTGPYRPTVVGSGAPAPDGSAAGVWRGGQGASLTLDLGSVRDFGGLIATWRGEGRPDSYSVSLSDDGAAWRLARRIAGAGGANDDLRLPDSAARYVRFDQISGSAGTPVLQKVEIEPLAFGATQNAFVEAVAARSRRGLFPRGFGEQAYWTLVGVDGGAESALISEDGAIELKRGGASVEPFVVDDTGLVTWADVAPRQSLDGDLPIPSVTWRRGGWELKVTAIAVGTPDASRLYGRYEIANLTGHPLHLTLGLAVRPFQVNGPRQFLGVAGGVSEIHDLQTCRQRQSSSTVRPRWSRSSRRPARAPWLSTPASIPRGCSAAHHLASRVADPTGLASGALAYDLNLAPGERRVLGWGAPLSGPAPDRAALVAGFPTALAEAEADWKSRLDTVAFTTPPAGAPLVAEVRTSLAHILMSRHGPVLQPGTRAYDRSWIRDGAMMAEALDRLGHAEVSAAYLRWYATHLFADGKVPCCVDARGSDPTPENDSEGEFLFLAAETYRYSGDRALLDSVWPQVVRTVDYMDALRRTERTAANLTPDRRRLYGLMPPSISHEGYSSKPAYSYWDDHWALRGYADAVFIAQALGERDAGERFDRSYAEFRDDLGASIRASAAAYRKPLLFGAADLGDFDPTSTTIALDPGGEAAWLPQPLLTATFERYWREFVARRDGATPWTDYTPYELRNVGALVRLGERERAWAVMTWLLDGRRPAAWNGWAEVVGRDAREPRFIGDLPHAWVASDFIRSALDLFAYDDPARRTLVLGAGIPAAWFETPQGVGVSALRTPYGQLNWSAREASNGLILRIAGDAAPGGGFDFPWPLARSPGAATLNGRPVAWRGRTLHLDGPGEVLIR